MRKPLCNQLVAWNCALFLVACASGPIDYPREPSEALVASQDTELGREVAEWSADKPGLSGFYPLSRGMDALGARLTLMDRAERTIDAQYFLMKSDEAGLIFAGKLLEAADRGVRVRFLLDDVFTNVDDHGLLLLDSHPNIEVRLFNPIARRGIYFLNYAGDFKRANRRMHNKSFIVDNQMGVIGGRNIAAEYFELDAHGEFVDFDMFMAGPVASAVSKTFDRFWNHELSVPMEAFSTDKTEVSIDEARQRIYDTIEDAASSDYAAAIQSKFVENVLAEDVELFPAQATVVTDDPDKLLHKTSNEYKVLINAVTQRMEAATKEVFIITPYLIPGEGGLVFLQSLAERGVRVLIFTNSLASTNHVSVHGAYSRYRKPLIEAGVELYEARANAVSEESAESGIEKLTLHTKGIVIDQETIFVGSLNIDPRSVDINTEMGVLIESKPLATLASNNTVKSLPGIAYRVTLDDAGSLTWTAEIDGKVEVTTTEPLSSGWRRFKASMSKILPEGQL